MKLKLLICLPIIVGLLAVSSCKKNEEGGTTLPVANPQPNILLIIADDMGLDAAPNYSIGAEKPKMPVLEGLMKEGITFDNVWAYPECSPTRASILTGRYGYRTGVLAVQENNQIPLSETSIQKHLEDKSSGYSSAVIGKWHLGGNSNGGNNNPANMGVKYYEGLITGGVQDYNSWTITKNGVQTNSTEYTTTKFTDLAIDWIDQQNQPWFLWLAYNAPHTPFHLPPNNLHDRDNLPTDQVSIDANPQPYFFAMLEAMDTEIGRLLSSLSEAERNNTLIVFIGDNGTARQVIQTPYRRQKTKSTLYNGGIAVPMMVSGYGVSRKNERETALINSTDLFATVADLAGTGTTEIHDSKSIRPLFSQTQSSFREYIYSEYKSGTTDYWTVRNSKYKLIEYANGDKELYDLSNDFFENTNLLSGTLNAEQASAQQNLEAEITRIRQ